MIPVKLTPNAPWTDRIIGKFWREIEAKVGPGLMPRESESSSAKKRQLEEYGCGHYGCVMPTQTPGMVFKLTTDALEAHFVASAIRIGHFPAGIVRYERVFRIPVEYRRRPVFVLWREEAGDVGWLGHHQSMWGKDDEYERRETRRFIDRLLTFKTWAGIFKANFDLMEDKAAVYQALERHQQMAWDRIGLEDVESSNGLDMVRRMRKPERLAAALRGCEILAEMMGSEYGGGGYVVGEALQFYLDNHVLLADVHLNNIGKVVREDYNEPVIAITDPGHAVPLDQSHDTVEVEVL